MGSDNNIVIKTAKKTPGRKRLARKLKEHLTNLDQVDALLKAEPDNEELKQLKTDLHQLIWLISDHLSSLKKKATVNVNDVMVDVDVYTRKAKGNNGPTLPSAPGPLVVPIVVKDPLNLTRISVKLVEMKDIGSIPNLPDFFYETGPDGVLLKPKGQGVKRKRAETVVEEVNGEDKPDVAGAIEGSECQGEGQSIQDGDGSGSPKRMKTNEKLGEDNDNTVTELVPATDGDDPCSGGVNGDQDQIDQSSPETTEAMNGESSNMSTSADTAACPKDESEGQSSQDASDIKKLMEEIIETTATANPESKNEEQGIQDDSGFKGTEFSEMNGETNNTPTSTSRNSSVDNGEQEQSIQNDTDSCLLTTTTEPRNDEASDNPTITSFKDGIGSEGQNSQEDASTSDIKKETEVTAATDEVMPNQDNNNPTSADAKTDVQCSQIPSDVKPEPEDEVKVEEMATEDTVTTSANNNDNSKTNDDQLDEGPGKDELTILEPATVPSISKALQNPSNRTNKTPEEIERLRKKRARAKANKAARANLSAAPIQLTPTAKRNKRKRNAKKNAKIREFLREHTIVMMDGKISIQTTPTEYPPLCQTCQKSLI